MGIGMGMGDGTRSTVVGDIHIDTAVRTPGLVDVHPPLVLVSTSTILTGKYHVVEPGEGYRYRYRI